MAGVAAVTGDGFRVGSLAPVRGKSDAWPGLVKILQRAAHLVHLGLTAGLFTGNDASCTVAQGTCHETSMCGCNIMHGFALVSGVRGSSVQRCASSRFFFRPEKHYCCGIWGNDTDVYIFPDVKSRQLGGLNPCWTPADRVIIVQCWLHLKQSYHHWLRLKGLDPVIYRSDGFTVDEREVWQLLNPWAWFPMTTGTCSQGWAGPQDARANTYPWQRDDSSPAGFEQHLQMNRRPSAR